MPRVDLAKSLRNAVISREADVGISPVAPDRAAPGPDHAAAPRSRRLRLVRRLLRPIIPYTDYIRRYFNAPVDQSLRDLQAQIESIALGQTQIAAQISRGNAQLTQVDARIGEIGAQIGRLGGGLDDLRATLGPRLDELDIKIRPVMTVDERSYAVRVRDGYVMLPREDPALAIMVANAASGGLEPGTRRVLQALIQPGMTVADIGANVGLLTLACARATGPTGKVYAFEPEARSREQLVKMLQLNGLTWVQAFDLAVGRRTEKAAFHLSPVIGHSSLHALPPEERAAGRITQVNVARLDDILPAGTRLDVVKIDVEGAELDVLAGMSRLIADNPDIALVAEFGPSHLDRLGVDAQAWLSAFTHAGFRLYEISELDGTCASADTAALLNRYSVNLAMVRPGGGGEARLPR